MTDRLHLLHDFHNARQRVRGHGKRRVRIVLAVLMSIAILATMWFGVL